MLLLQLHQPPFTAGLGLARLLYLRTNHGKLGAMRMTGCLAKRPTQIIPAFSLLSHGRLLRHFDNRFMVYELTPRPCRPQLAWNLVTPTNFCSFRDYSRVTNTRKPYLSASNVIQRHIYTNQFGTARQPSPSFLQRVLLIGVKMLTWLSLFLGLVLMLLGAFGVYIRVYNVCMIGSTVTETEALAALVRRIEHLQDSRGCNCAECLDPVAKQQLLKDLQVEKTNVVQGYEKRGVTWERSHEPVPTVSGRWIDNRLSRKWSVKWVPWSVYEIGFGWNSNDNPTVIAAG